MCRFENSEAEIVVDEVPHKVAFWNTDGQQEFERLRVLSYPNVIHLTLQNSSLNPPHNALPFADWLKQGDHIVHYTYKRKQGRFAKCVIRVSQSPAASCSLELFIEQDVKLFEPQPLSCVFPHARP